jgi:hypothetical protein
MKCPQGPWKKVSSYAITSKTLGLCDVGKKQPEIDRIELAVQRDCAMDD